MTDRSDTASELMELATLPPADPRRAEFQQRIGSLSAAQRQEWLAVQKESDQLRTSLQQVEPPTDLMDKLLAIPDRITVSKGFWRGRTAQWGAVAAILIVLAGVAIYMNMPAPPPEEPKALADAIANPVAEEAVKFHAALPPLQTTSSDPKEVEKSLQQVMAIAKVIVPHDKSFVLEGGGECMIDGAKAVFTRWHDSSSSYTVYQIDSGPLKSPESYVTTMKTPEPAGDPHKYRVVIWPGMGGKCAWALVMDNPSAHDAFSSYSYGG